VQHHEALKDTLQLLRDEASRGALDTAGGELGDFAEGEDPH
jgi:hypothetical protein